MVPRMVGPWRLGVQLGRGGMGTVFRAEHEATGAPAAVKMVPAPAPEMVAGIRREIGALRRIAHPGVVAILDDGLADGVPWYAMELVEGPSLREVMRCGEGGGADSTEVVSSSWETRTIDRDAPSMTAPGLVVFPPARALAIVRALCRALAFVHGEGMVHRDLKPDNVLQRPDGTWAIVDFGLMKLVPSQGGRESLDVTAAIVGTPSYIAPEQVRGGGIDARTDIYALGCILYEMLTGRPPFVGSVAEVLAQHQRARPLLPSRLVQAVPPGVDALVDALLAKDPRRRIGYAADVDARIDALGVAAPPPAQGAEPAPRSYLYRPSLAGRTGLLEEIDAALEHEESSRGRCLLLAGESGVGKTRLLSEIGLRASRLHHLVLAGGCEPGAPPLSALRSVLQAIGDRCRHEGAEAASRVLGMAGRRLSLVEPSLGEIPGVAGLPEPVPIPGEEGKSRTVADLTAVLARTAAQQRTVVILDDVQWADELAAAALLRWLRVGVPPGLLVIAAHRAEEPGPMAEARLGEGARRIEIPRLDEEAVRAIVGDMLASEAIPSELIPFLATHTEGNPFFVAEYLHAAVSRGLLARDRRGAWRWDASGATAASLARLGIPRTLRELLTRRIDDLEPAARALLDAGAVIGRESGLDLLRAASGASDADADAAIGELLRRRFLTEAPGRVRFEHDKLREVAYELLPPERRRALHRRVAEQLAGGGVREGSAALLGLHWEMAGEAERAAERYVEAGIEASDRYASREADEAFRAALRLSPDPKLRARARIELARTVLAPRGRNDEALAALQVALEELGPDSPGAVQVLTSMVHSLSELGRFGEAEEMARRLVALHAAGGDAWRRAGALGDLAAVIDEAGRGAEARVVFDEALAAYDASGNPTGRATVVANLALLLWRQGDMDGAVPRFEEALAQHRASGHRTNEGVVLGNLAIIRFYRGEREGAEKLFREALEIHRFVGNRRGEGLVLGNLANLLASGDDHRGARAALEEAIAIQRETGNARSEVLSLTNLAALDVEAGDLEGARRTLRLARERTALDPTPRTLAYVDARDAHASLAAGDPAAAIASAGGAREVFAGLGDLYGEALASCFLGRALAATGAPCEEQLLRVRQIVAGIQAGPRSDLARELGLLEAAARPAG